MRVKSVRGYWALVSPHHFKQIFFGESWLLFCYLVPLVLVFDRGGSGIGKEEGRNEVKRNGCSRPEVEVVPCEASERTSSTRPCLKRAYRIETFVVSTVMYRGEFGLPPWNVLGLV